MTENKNNPNTPSKKPNYLLRRAGAVAAAAVLAGGVAKGVSEINGESASAGTKQEQEDVNPYSITSPPAEVGEGTDDLVQKVFPNANELPEGVIKVDQLGSDDSILGVGERAVISVPDEESFRKARGLEPPTNTQN